MEFTPASIHDSKVFEHLVDYTEEAIFADKGYANQKRREELVRRMLCKERNIFDGILSKGYAQHSSNRNKPLSRAEKRTNRILSRVRNKVERALAYIKKILNYQRCSYMT